MPDLQANFDRVKEVAFDHNQELPHSYQSQLFTEGIRALERHSGQNKVLLIGGAGYVGSVVTEYFLKQGYHVRCLDRLLYENDLCILPYFSKSNYEFIYGDLDDPTTLDLALEGVRDVVILAGLVGDPITKKYPEASQKINVDGLQKVIQQLNGRNLNKVVFVSTCSNYGLIEDDVLADETFALKPLSLYAKAKVQIEQELLSRQGNVDYFPTILRFATAFGLSPRMRFDLTISEFTREMFLKKELVVYDAETWRPYCHVQDFSLLIRRVLEAPMERVAFEVFNAGGDVNNFTKQKIVDTIKGFLPDAPIKYQNQGSDPRNYKVNFQKIRETLYFEPHYTVSKGIEELIGALQQNLFSRVESQSNFYGNYNINYQ